MKKRSLPDSPPKAENLEEVQHLIDELWLLLVEKERQADAVHQHYCPTHFPCGGAVLRRRELTYRHQIFDLPDVIPYRMEEHQLFHVDGDQCGQRHKARLPDNVSPTQMGPNLLALTGVLAGHYHLSLSLTRELVNDLFGLPFSIGAYSQAQGQLSPMLTRNHQALHVGNSSDLCQTHTIVDQCEYL